jgi:GTP cyclohydrolase IB
VLPLPREGWGEGKSTLSAPIRNPQSAFRTPHSALRTWPRDTFCILGVTYYFRQMLVSRQNGTSRARSSAAVLSEHPASRSAGQSPQPSKLHDKQSERDYRDLRIDKVGVRGLRFPIQVRDRAHAIQNTVATIGMFVDLPKEFKGTHMSRFIEVLNAHGNIVHVENITEILHALQQKFKADTSHLEMEFPYFMVKQAPVSGMESVMDYIARFDAAACHREIDFVLTVKAMVTTLCPCSKAIAAYGAHNQRGEVTVQIRSRKAVWIEDLIGIIEGSASSELYALLKRQDEKAVTERAYENPVFVEDLVRNVAVKLNAHPDVTWYKVEAENQESIHNHNAYACIQKA